DRAAGGGLPAAGLADQAERLTLLDEEVDAIDGAHRADLALKDDPLRQREVHLERLDVEEVPSALRGRGAADPDVVGGRRGRRHGHLCTSNSASAGAAAGFLRPSSAPRAASAGWRTAHWCPPSRPPSRRSSRG